jgi:hypothetical protein
MVICIFLIVILLPAVIMKCVFFFFWLAMCPTKLFFVEHALGGIAVWI